ncbi:MAG: MoxR family ATPase [Euryarchaeota archaeon]|nr:MoxR family ATPase [Euryarchaeota archaeon]
MAAPQAHLRRIVAQVSEYYLGKERVVDKLLAGVLAGGHVLFQDYPGLGKTLLVKSFAKTVGAEFKRIQFTPDILPSDILGSNIYDSEAKAFRLMKGPIFTNILLADEINRSPPKTQSALLEAMEERQVTIDGRSLPLPNPFFVLATQNPIEQEGTYPLPEAQLDRFTMILSTGYPDSVELEGEILEKRIGWKRDDPTDRIQPTVTLDELLRLRSVVETVYVDREIILYISKLVRGIRAHPFVQVGPSPRGSLSLLKVARAGALLAGRDYVIPDDVKRFAQECLVHRTILKVEHALEGRTPVEALSTVLSNTALPTGLGVRK